MTDTEEPKTPQPTADDLARARFEKLAATGSIETGLEILDRLDAFYEFLEREPPSPSVPPTPD